jgi:2-polyprenyl-6-methoxyphenol hydroxylase-like FAD-dependent oxidoreductase
MLANDVEGGDRMATSPSGEAQVLVVGAGPTGLMMASQLARHGVAVRVVDRAAAACAESRALGVQSRTLEIFDDLGIIQQALALGLPMHGASIHAGGHRLLHLSLDELDSPYPFILDLPQSQTERLLGSYLEGLGARVERQVELVGLTQDARSVTATLRHADGREETVAAPWLVGCDGAHSTVRHALGLPFEGAAYPEGWILADVRLHWSLPDDELHMFLRPGGGLAVFPLRGGRARVIAEVPLPSPEGEAPTPTLADVQRLVQERAVADATVDDPVWLSSFRIHRRHAPHNRQGRVFVAGDAVHIHSPFGGQGMNTGLQDAYNLAWKLGLVLAGRAPETLLDSYDAEREPIAEGLLRFTDALTRIATVRNPLAANLRDHLFGLLVQQEVVQQRMANQIAELKVGYRHSPIVDEHAGSRFGHRRSLSGPRPGDRAPDARPLALADGSTVSLLDVYRGTHHTLLLFAGPAADAGAVARLDALGSAVVQRYGSLIRPYVALATAAPPAAGSTTTPLLLDPEQNLHHRYGADAECLYLVRPDKYVGFRAQPADQASLEAYLGRIFLAP